MIKNFIKKISALALLGSSLIARTELEVQNLSFVSIDLQDTFVGRKSYSRPCDGVFSQKYHEALMPEIINFVQAIVDADGRVLQSLDAHPKDHISFQELYKKLISSFPEEEHELFRVIGADSTSWIVRLTGETRKQLLNNQVCVMVDVLFSLPENKEVVILGEITDGETTFQKISIDLQNLEFESQATFTEHGVRFVSPEDSTSFASIFSEELISNDNTIVKGLLSSKDSFSAYDLHSSTLAFIESDQFDSEQKLKILLEKKSLLTTPLHILSQINYDFDSETNSVVGSFNDEIFFGCATEFCVKATVLDAIKTRSEVMSSYNLSKIPYEIFVIAEYSAPFDYNNQNTVLDELKAAGARIITNVKIENDKMSFDEWTA